MISWIPPVALATGSAPYARLYIALNPAGSMRDGIKLISMPASITCAVFFIIALLIGKFRGKLASGDGQRRLIRGIAFSENDQADIIRKQPIEKRHKNLEPFFLNDACDHSVNRPDRIRGQSQPA